MGAPRDPSSHTSAADDPSQDALPALPPLVDAAAASRARRPHAAGSWRAGRARQFVVWLVTAVLVSLLAVNGARVPGDTVRVGDIAPRTVKAPFPFTYQDLATWEAERDAAGDAAPAVWAFDPEVGAQAAQRVMAAFRAGREALAGDPTAVEDPARRADAVARFLDAGAFLLSADGLEPLAEAGFPAGAEARVLSWLEEAYAEDRLIVPDGASVPRDRPLQVRGAGEEASWRVERDALATPEAVRDDLTLAALKVRRSPPWTDAALELARSLVRPNVGPDEAATEAARAEAEATLSPEPIRVQRGEILFREGDRLTGRDVAKYVALQRSRTDHGLLFGLFAMAGLNAVVLISLHLASSALNLTRRDEDRDRVVLATAAVLVLSLALLRLVVAAAPGIATLLGLDAQARLVWYAAPMAGGAILVRELMGARRALGWLLASIVPAALITHLDAAFLSYLLLTGVVAIAVSSTMRERMDALRAGLQVGVFGALVVVFLHFVALYAGDGELSLATTIRPMWSVGAALVGGLLSGFLVLGLVPVVERLGFVTDHRMLELASLNHPLMRQLMLRAPGTYHHSVVVGTLAEAACDAIGANGIQAKIAAYFHDIGKALKPNYFVENQRDGINRHAEIDPATSAEVIIAHVTEGARMAREHRLPQPIIDNIQMHHGTGLLQFFYAKAQMQADDPSTVDEATYRYPGPKPSTREAGVVMLADKIEAATRTIQHPTEDNIRAMILRIVNSVMADGQFDECPLTFREIHIVVETFVAVLLGIYHQRIEYPQTRSLSRSAVVSEPSQAAIGAGAPGTITLELEAPEVSIPADWRDKETTDETTDYESVRNLPQGRA